MNYNFSAAVFLFMSSDTKVNECVAPNYNRDVTGKRFVLSLMLKKLR